jgi:ADP-L-glycero-D-manno-heptose 6-epimerase
MRLLVTGGAGFIGSNLAKKLESDSHDVVVLDDFSSGDFRTLVGFKGEVITGNCTQEPKGPFDAIFHQASITDTTVLDQNKMMANNVEGFRHVLEWAAVRKARVIWASSASIYGNSKAPNKETDPPAPLNVYAYSKLAMERMADRWHKKTDLPIIGLRYFNVYGPGEAHKAKFASMIWQLAQQMKAAKRPRIFKMGQQKRDFVCVEDVLQANLLALKAKASGVFNAGSGAAGSFNDVVACLNKSMNTSLEPDYFDNPYNFTQDHTEADISAAKKALGYAPAYTLEKGIDFYLNSGAL